MYRAVACFLATCLTHLAYLGCAFLLVNGRNWQLHFLLSPIFCQSSKKAQPRYAKCVRQVARSKRQHGIIHSVVYKFEIEYCWTSLIHNAFHLEIRYSVMRDQTSARTEIDHLAKSVPHENT